MILNLFLYGVPKKCVYTILIQSPLLCNIFVYIHSTFVSVHTVFRFYLLNDSIMYPHHTLNPKWNFCLTRNVSLYSTFSKLYRIGVFHNLFRNPAWSFILPMNINLPPFCCLSLVLVIILCCDESILLFDLWSVFRSSMSSSNKTCQFPSP